MSILKSIRNFIKSFNDDKSDKGIVIKEIKLEGNQTPRRAKRTDVIEPAEKRSSEIKGDGLKKERPRRSRKKKEKSPEQSDIILPVVDDGPLIEDFIPEEWDVSQFSPEAIDGKLPFTEVGLPHQILRGIKDAGYEYCTEIQKEILPHSLKGLDVIGKAQTGTGKTAAFLLTIFQRLMQKPRKSREFASPRALIMAPTRELALQIEKDARLIGAYCGARILSIFGGMGYGKQLEALNNKYIDIVIATPGRILDYYKQHNIRLDRVEILVLDEADRMLDMGFLPDMRRIINATPPREKRQTMLFSATISSDILRLASAWTVNPIKVEIEPEHVAASNIEQIAYIVTQKDKYVLLSNLLRKSTGKSIIFANRREQVKKLADRLRKNGFECGVLTGDMNQHKRIKTLENFRDGKVPILVATDVAGRGIHVDDIQTVYNYTLPNYPDDYVHRIGRTGRAGAEGASVSFATEEDAYLLPGIEEHLNQKLAYISPEDELLKEIK